MDLKEYVAKKEAELDSISTIRVENIETPRAADFRHDRDIDYARVLHSASFRRLQGKMQLFAPGTLRFHRNRLTHSNEVAQVARSIALRLGLKDTITVQTCALAHDIGNPPFGHKGEDVLNSCGSLYYEGNAQTFRILRWVEEKHWDHNGLNLTLRTMLGVCKYPFSSAQDPKKHLYEEVAGAPFNQSDCSIVQTWAASHNVSLRTIDCEIMDLADEIAYASHDLEDALRQRFFNVDDLIHEFRDSDYKDAVTVLEDVVKDTKAFAAKAKTWHSADEYNVLLMKELASRIVHLLILDIGVVDDKGKMRLGYVNHANLALGLKKLTFRAVNRRAEVMQYERMGEKVVKGLFEVFIDREFNKGMMLLPPNYRAEHMWERKVKDYISGMMDNFAIQQYELYFGRGAANRLYQPTPSTGMPAVVAAKQASAGE